MTRPFVIVLGESLFGAIGIGSAHELVALDS
jgi:hypothetical protein